MNYKLTKVAALGVLVAEVMGVGVVCAGEMSRRLNGHWAAVFEGQWSFGKHGKSIECSRDDSYFQVTLLLMRLFNYLMLVAWILFVSTLAPLQC